MPRLGFKHLTFRVQEERSNRLRHRRGRLRRKAKDKQTKNQYPLVYCDETGEKLLI